MYELIFTFDIKEYKKNDAIIRYINDNYAIFKKKHVLFKVNLVDTILTDNNVLKTSAQDNCQCPQLHITNGNKTFGTYKSIFEYIYNLKTDFERENLNTNMNTFIPSSSKKLFNQSMDSNDITNKMYLDTF